jgi:ApbE superfamily uncharacterized protein (UPF0280 family)
MGNEYKRRELFRQGNSAVLTADVHEYYNIFYFAGERRNAPTEGKEEGFQERTYRDLLRGDDLVGFEVIVKETDLYVRAERDLSSETRESVLKYRHQIETYIEGVPEFERSLVPIQDDRYAPALVREMIRTSRLAQVGPMAAVAGAIAEAVSRDLLFHSKEVIIENGGDIFLAIRKERVIGVYAGSSPLSLKIGIRIDPDESPVGVCTSSGTVGHSLSFGRADAVCILSASAALADAAATSVGNLVHGKGDIEKGLERGREIPGLRGVLIVVEDKIGAWGNVELVQL